jgi:hypothetical protein
MYKLILIVIIFLIFSEYQDMYSQLRQKEIIFEEIDQSFNILKQETPKIRYAIEDYDTLQYYIKYQDYGDYYKLTLKRNLFYVNSQADDKPASDTLVLFVDPQTGEISYKNLDEKDIARTITFVHMNQVEIIEPSQFIRILYDSKIDPGMTFFTYKSLDNGSYEMQIVPKGEGRTFVFNKMCDIFQSSYLESINFSVDRSLRYEQIIITPPAGNGPWEIRCGTVERNCTSQSLSKLKKVQDNTEYLNKRAYNNKFYKGSGKKK